MLTRSCLAMVLTAAAGCAVDVSSAYPMQMPWGRRVEMNCAGGKSMAVDFVPSPRAARVTLDAQTITLPQVDSAADAQFTNGRFTLYINDNRAALEETGMVRRGPCTPR